jgi:hypothetical protein
MTPTPGAEEKKSFDKSLQDIRASAAMPDETPAALPDNRNAEQPDVDSVLSEIERAPTQTPSTSPRG